MSLLVNCIELKKCKIKENGWTIFKNIYKGWFYEENKTSSDINYFFDFLWL